LPIVKQAPIEQTKANVRGNALKSTIVHRKEGGFQLHSLSVRFLVPAMRRGRGGGGS
jgi:hypothetical protein